MTTELKTAAAMILLSASFAFFISPDPRYCPTMIATASPIAINAILKMLFIVFAMFWPATTFSPLKEYACPSIATPTDQRPSFTRIGVPVTKNLLTSARGTSRVLYIPLKYVCVSLCLSDHTITTIASMYLETTVATAAPMTPIRGQPK